VLILHGTGGNGLGFMSENFAGVLFGPGQLLDASKYYTILPDGIGHGLSSKPSDGARARFPQYTYHDMVVAQHRLLTEGLGVSHLRLVMGTSMGGMQTWMHGEMYPDFMDALMPLASLPVEIAGYNRMRRKMMMDSITLDPAWKNGDYTEQPSGLRYAAYGLICMSATPKVLQETAPTREEADRLLDQMVERSLCRMDANDFLYQLNSSREYNPSPLLEKIKAPLVAVNSADDLVNPPELGILEREIKRVERGRCVVIPISDATRGHGTHSIAALWKGELEQLLNDAK